MNESQGKAMIGLGSDTNYLKSLIIQKKYVFFTGSCVSFALSVPCGFERFHRAGQGKDGVLQGGARLPVSPSGRVLQGGTSITAS